MSTPLARAQARVQAIASRARESEAEVRAENRRRYPKFTAFVDAIRRFDPHARVTYFNREIGE